MTSDNYITGDIFTAKPQRQTLKAWEPYEDCRTILFLFQNSDIDDEHPEWRLYWVAGIALLRTIGHTLIKADALVSQRHERLIGTLWEGWKRRSSENKIFWEFIETERNNILKTYTFGAVLKEDDQGSFVQYGDGEDAMELYRVAVYWWRHQLNFLEAQLAASEQDQSAEI